MTSTNQNQYSLSLKKLPLLSYLWLIAAIFGNPVYNVIAFFICQGFGFSKTLSTNESQVDPRIYVFLLICIFTVRLAVYRVIFNHMLKLKMTTLFFLKVFVQRHAFQVLGIWTFFMWTMEVEGNIAGFILLPLTIIAAIIVCPITNTRIFTIRDYIYKQKDTKIPIVLR